MGLCPRLQHFRRACGRIAPMASPIQLAQTSRRHTISNTNQQTRSNREQPVEAPQLERQLMQELPDAGWVKAAALPPFPKTIEGLLSKGWIERRGGGNDTCYRLTDEGLAAKMAPLRIYD